MSNNVAAYLGCSSVTDIYNEIWQLIYNVQGLNLPIVEGLAPFERRLYIMRLIEQREMEKQAAEAAKNGGNQRDIRSMPMPGEQSHGLTQTEAMTNPYARNR